MELGSRLTVAGNNEFPSNKGQSGGSHLFTICVFLLNHNLPVASRECCEAKNVGEGTTTIRAKKNCSDYCTNELGSDDHFWFYALLSI